MLPTSIFFHTFLQYKTAAVKQEAACKLPNSFVLYEMVNFCHAKKI